MKDSSGNYLYPPLRVERKNQTHLLRVVIDSKEMVKFLKDNYATPINGSGKPYYYFDIVTNFDETKLIAQTEVRFLEVVDGMKNPKFYRRAKLINKGMRKGRSNLGD